MGILNRIGLVFARKWIAGTSIEEVIQESLRINGLGEKVIINYLGEDVKEGGKIGREVQTYLDLLSSMKKNSVKGGIAIKPTQLGLDVSYAMFLHNYAKIARKASRLGIFVWLDMEDYQFVDGTIRAYLQSIKKYKNLGICIQSKLLRSMSDLKRLAPKGAIVRLVKGAYKSHPSVTYGSKEEIDRNYGQCMEYLFANCKRFMIATHDSVFINKAIRLQKEHHVRIMFGMLKGIRPNRSLELAKEGQDMYIYVPFGQDWVNYSLRRFREKEHSMLVLRSIFQG